MDNIIKIALAVTLAVWVAGCNNLAGLNAEKKNIERQIIESPDKSLKVSLSLDESGRAFYSISRNGEQVLLPSQLGVELNSQAFTDGLTITDVDAGKVSENYTLLHGKQRDINYIANEKIYTVKNKQGDKLTIAFRVSNDGVAFQYRFPNSAKQSLAVKKEITSFAFEQTTKAWLQPIAVAQTGWANTNPSYEEHYQMNIPVGTVSPSPAGWVFPALFKANKHWLLITEAGMNGDYHASRLHAESPNGEYSLGIPMAAEVFEQDGNKGALLAQSNTAFHSPWRVILVGGLDTIIASTLGTDLADPAIAKMDFVKPGTASWSWALLKDESVNYETSLEFIDYAAEMGWAYTLVDADWDRRIGYERTAQLAAYAQSKNVGLLVWYNSSGDWNTTEYSPKSTLLDRDKRRAEFARVQNMGVKGVKIDFFPGDGKSVMAYYNDLAKDAADYNLLVNYHGSSLPRGLHRTYPNIMTMESVHGFEMITFMQPSADKAATHMAMLPFTRNAFDPMDFTPTTFSDIPNIERRTSNGFELALPVLFLSGLQHIAETAEGMATNAPDYVKAYMRDIPVLWDESKLIDGMPGEHVVIARKHGERWFVAGINATNEAINLEMNFDFALGKKGKLITDSNKSTKGVESFTSQTITATKNNALTVKANGGFVIVFN
ncbi:glycoside hydrolase family 97 protein [Saccharophagus degradans]|uniref:Glycoside hydrolase family 97 N-terminal domain-containing protein n=1 Tax=Saccharophagus degradans TaxID=86304 RepID=A0AAW7X8G7_9GAMM|nr:glycoside hydrolase family 97 protein [Saccharophagus degradans]MDO6423142.1 glycoside hydrolase family 97 N-terminal domain-containing protein [Saccharophagus degradans]MDO6607334.1 glycoside hydrolase family 97 N-terminal domain-containing protein [Saccharophagus degradans]